MKLSVKSSVSYLMLVYLFFYSPIFVLIAYSFNHSNYSLIWHGFTFEWYKQLFHDGDLWIAAGHSLIVATIASVLSAVIGTLGAVSLYRYQFMGKKLLHGLIFILIVTPDLVLGIALLMLFSFLHIQLGFFSLVLAHTTFCIPFVVVTIYGRITGIDKNIFEAARDLGAQELATFMKITVPLLFPAIVAGLLLSFTLSFDDVIISYFVSGPGFEILPLKIYSMARLGVKPELNALCSIIFVMTLAFVIVSQLLIRKKT